MTRTFYGAVLDHVHEPTDEPGTTTLHRDGPAMGAVVGAGDALPHWLVHFAVDDLDGAVAAVPTVGGEVLLGPDEAAGRARGPVGGAFAVISRR
ncbi:MAG TPA: hypothetical protein VGH76_18355 [Actinomycetospora sp.]|uniref:hypothetical protein n=1 Tax=Actinomycetospora sp. TaxID=1872135 RepID=UPI002F419327